MIKVGSASLWCLTSSLLESLDLEALTSQQNSALLTIIQLDFVASNSKSSLFLTVVGALLHLLGHHDQIAVV